jgi:uncharacterized membrane protein
MQTTPQQLFNPTQQQTIVNAIKNAELGTSGEIRVHIESTCTLPVMERAIAVFYSLKMDNTELNNGVLVYVAIDAKKMAVVGGEGINIKVGQDFWNDVIAQLRNSFAQLNYTQGLTDAVTEIGKKLSHYFPVQNNDTNELTNDISFGE